MNHLFWLAVFFVISLFGDFISNTLSIPVPGNILGMIILFLLLCFKVIKLESIKKTGQFLIDNMLLFILPAAVGIVSTYHMVEDRIFLYIFINIITTVIVFAVTARVSQFMIKKQRKKQPPVLLEDKDGG